MPALPAFKLKSIEFGTVLSLWLGGIFCLSVFVASHHYDTEARQYAGDVVAIRKNFTSLESSSKEVKCDVYNTKFYWLGKDPVHASSAFLYYQRFGEALRTSSFFNFCEKDLESCMSWTKSPSGSKSLTMVLAIPHVEASNLDSLQASLQQASGAIRLLQQKHQETGGVRTKVILVLFLNKLYVDLEHKIKAFQKVASQSATKSIFGFSLEKMAFTWSPLADVWTREYGISVVHIPFAANPEDFDTRGRNRQNKTECDIFLRWDTNPEKYELRQEISALLTAPKFLEETGLHVIAPTSFISHEMYLGYLSSCEFQISTIGMPGRFNLVGTRYFEVLASGTGLLFSQKPNVTTLSAYETLDIDENITVFFSSAAELIEKMVYYKQHPEEAAVLIDNARLWSNRNVWSDRARRASKHIDQLICDE